MHRSLALQAMRSPACCMPDDNGESFGKQQSGAKLRAIQLTPREIRRRHAFPTLECTARKMHAKSRSAETHAMGKYIERQAENPDDPNKYCTLFFVADDATEYPIHCGCGGCDFLCELHKRELLAGEQRLTGCSGLTSTTISVHASGRSIARSSGPQRWASRVARWQRAR